MSEDVDVVERLREMADELEQADEDDLPELDGFPMKREIDHPLHGFRIYEGEDRAAWVEVTEEESGWCLGGRVEEFVEAVREADNYE